MPSIVRAVKTKREDSTSLVWILSRLVHLVVVFILIDALLLSPNLILGYKIEPEAALRALDESSQVDDDVLPSVTSSPSTQLSSSSLWVDLVRSRSAKRSATSQKLNIVIKGAGRKEFQELIANLKTLQDFLNTTQKSFAQMSSTSQNQQIKKQFDMKLNGLLKELENKLSTLLRSKKITFEEYKHWQRIIFSFG